MRRGQESIANDGENINYPGISFWIVCNWPEYGIEKIELELTKQFLEPGLNIRKCKEKNGTLGRKAYTEVKAGLEKIKFANLQYKLQSWPKPNETPLPPTSMLF